MPIKTIREYLALRLFSHPTRENDSYSLYRCPFHSPDVKPSFCLYDSHPAPSEHHFRCYSLSCGVSGRGLYGIVRIHRFDGEDKQREILTILDELEENFLEKRAFVRKEAMVFHREERLPTQEERTLLTAAMRFWQKALFFNHQQAVETRRYLQSRGVSLNFAREGGTVGYAPFIKKDSSVYRSFCRTLSEAVGPTWKEVAQGLGILNQEEKVSLQHRLMFAQRNTEGEVISFQGRTLFEGEEAKNTAKFLMPKGLVKPAYWLPVKSPGMQGTVSLESYFGVLLLAQPTSSFGGMHAVASLGNNTVIPFETFPSPLYCGEDNDPLKYSTVFKEWVRAGDVLAQKHMEYCQERGIPCKRVRVPWQDKDIDTFIVRYGREAFLHLLLDYQEIWEEERAFFYDIAM